MPQILDQLRKHVRDPQKGAIIAGSVFGVALLIFVMSLFSSEEPYHETGAWFYDLGTQQLFVAPINALEPIDAPSGPGPDGKPQGVRAFVFGCGSCAESERSIGYLRKFSDQAKAAIEAGKDESRLGVFVRSEEGEKWFDQRSRDGIAITRTAIERCKKTGKRVERCAPQ